MVVVSLAVCKVRRFAGCRTLEKQTHVLKGQDHRIAPPLLVQIPMS